MAFVVSQTSWGCRKINSSLPLTQHGRCRWSTNHTLSLLSVQALEGGGNNPTLRAVVETVWSLDGVEGFEQDLEDAAYRAGQRSCSASDVVEEVHMIDIDSENLSTATDLGEPVVARPFSSHRRVVPHHYQLRICPAAQSLTPQTATVTDRASFVTGCTGGHP